MRPASAPADCWRKACRRRRPAEQYRARCPRTDRNAQIRSRETSARSSRAPADDGVCVAPPTGFASAASPSFADARNKPQKPRARSPWRRSFPDGQSRARIGRRRARCASAARRVRAPETAALREPKPAQPPPVRLPRIYGLSLPPSHSPSKITTGNLAQSDRWDTRPPIVGGSSKTNDLEKAQQTQAFFVFLV